MSDRIRVVWICTFSNEQVRTHTHLHIGFFNKLMWKLMRNKTLGRKTDIGVWNTNGIKEFEKFDDVELHIISPCLYLKDRVQEFDINGVHYHIFRDERGQFLTSIYLKVFKPCFFNFRRNRFLINSIIKKICPDIVHMIGAENPQYSLSLLDIPHYIPTIVQLQTLMSDPEFRSNYHIDSRSYDYRSQVERSVLCRSDYLGTRATKYINIIREKIKPDAHFINISLAVGETLDLSPVDKQFDFVYFARDLEKAGDIAVEAFGIAHKAYPSITLDLVGAYNQKFRKKLEQIIDKFSIASSVTFEGAPDTHNAIMRQIKKSKFALLPLKIDLTSSTIREAMAKGLPVITTDTGVLGTQKLNVPKRTVLISNKDDVNDLANKMIMLLTNETLANEIRDNAASFMQLRYCNEALMRDWVKAYRMCIKEHKQYS